MYCKNCGKEINDKANVCVGCGVFIEQDTTSQHGKLSNASEDSIARINWIFALISISAAFYDIVFTLIGGFVFSWIFGGISLIFGTLTFIICLYKKQNNKFAPILAFIISIPLILFAILLTIGW